MADKPKTGSVIAKKGKVTARNIIVGMDIQGAAGDEVLKTALETMQHLRTGHVRGAEGVEASGDIVVGFRHLNPEAPDPESFVAELRALRQALAGLQREPEAAANIEAASEAVDDTIAEAGKAAPLPKKVVNRLRDAVEFITDAGKALDAAGKAGPLVVQAIGTATTLYRMAQALF